jgi:hypothetical protein
MRGGDAGVAAGVVLLARGALDPPDPVAELPGSDDPVQPLTPKTRSALITTQPVVLREYSIR